MDVLRRNHFHFSIVFSLLGVLFLATTALYLSGTLSTITTAIMRPKASSATPKITQSIVEPFKTDNIDTNKWQIRKSQDVNVAQTASDNLRIDIPAGSVGGNARQGSITYKQVLKDKGDFRLVAVIFRPIVTGNGNGVAGLRFASTGSENDEGASIRWVVNGSSSRIVFTVNAPDGSVLMNKSSPIKSNIAVFTLVRINNIYRGAFSVGADTSGDSVATVLGEIGNQSLGQDGNLTLFASNNGGNNNFPKVIARFDTAWIGWEGIPITPGPDRNRFSDNFANGVIAAKWTKSAPAGVGISETAADNLNINISAGSTNAKPHAGDVIRNEPVVPQNKNFQFRATLFKPRVIGNGTGIAGIAFVSNTNVDDEDARIQWIVSGTTSRLVFLVRAPDGTLLEKTSAHVNAPELSIILRRTGNKYQAWYHIGDTDNANVSLGNEQNGSLGGNGKFRLFASNTGSDHLFPQVIAKFDGANAYVDK